MEHFLQHIESLIFSTNDPISIAEIKDCLDERFDTEIQIADIEEAVQTLKEKYKQAEFAFELVEINEGLQFMSKGAYFDTIAIHLRQTTRRRLSKAALETLSIIAYKQPVEKSEVEHIRGVNCDYTIQKLLEKELVEIEGRSDTPGRPLIYGTSEKFMDYFGLKSIKDLPQLKDFQKPDSEIGEAAPVEDETALHEEE